LRSLEKKKSATDVKKHYKPPSTVAAPATPAPHVVPQHEAKRPYVPLGIPKDFNRPISEQQAKSPSSHSSSHGPVSPRFQPEHNEGDDLRVKEEEEKRTKEKEELEKKEEELQDSQQTEELIKKEEERMLKSFNLGPAPKQAVSPRPVVVAPKQKNAEEEEERRLAKQFNLGTGKPVASKSPREPQEPQPISPTPNLEVETEENQDEAAKEEQRMMKQFNLSSLTKKPATTNPISPRSPTSTNSGDMFKQLGIIKK